MAGGSPARLSRPRCLAGDGASAQRGAGGDHQGFGDVALRRVGAQGEAGPVGSGLAHDAVDGRLLEGQVGLAFEELFHLQAVEALVGLGAGDLDRRPLAGVQHANLDEGAVDDAPHRAAKGVDLADDVALGGPADGGVARHQRHRVQVHRHEEGAASHARGAQRGLAAGVPRADDGDVVGRDGGASRRVHWGVLHQSKSVGRSGWRWCSKTWASWSGVTLARGSAATSSSEKKAHFGGLDARRRLAACLVAEEEDLVAVPGMRCLGVEETVIDGDELARLGDVPRLLEYLPLDALAWRLVDLGPPRRGIAQPPARSSLTIRSRSPSKTAPRTSTLGVA